MANEEAEERSPNAFGGKTDSEVLAFYDEVFGASHRAGAIVIVAQVDTALRSAILGRLKELSPTEEGRLFSGAAAPLSSMHSKILVGYSLGLFSDAVREDLVVLKDIRNLFAHERDVRTFDHPEVVKLCDKLNFPHSVSLVRRGLALGRPVDLSSAKGKFENTAMVVDLALSSGKNKFFARRPAKETFIDYSHRPGVRAPSRKKRR
jgi:hypothetical protein